MNKVLIILICFISIQLLVQSLNPNQLDFQSEAVNTLIIAMIDFIINISNLSVFLKPSFEKCISALVLNATQNSDSFQDTFNYCGKDISDQGQEKACMKNPNTTYFLFKYSLRLNDSYFIDTPTPDQRVMQFLQVSKIYTGFCMYKDCMPFLVQDYFNETKNQKLFDYLNETAHIGNISFMLEADFKYLNSSNDNEESTSKSYNSILSVVFIVITCFSISLFCLMFIISVIRMLYSLFLDDSKESILNIGDDILFPYVEKNSFSDLGRDVSDPNIKPNNNDNKTPCISAKKLHFISRYFDFFYYCSYLFQLKNRYYNDEGLEVLSFVRSIVMFFLVYFYICYSALIMPPQDPFNFGFYTSINFWLVKFSTFSAVCWIILDGATVSYKLMSAIKNNIKGHSRKSYHNINTDTVSIKLFCTFALYSISKIIMVVLLFFYVNKLGSYFSEYFNMGLLYEYFYNNVIEKECLAESFPLCIIWSDYNDALFYLNVYQNELYCFIIVLILIYISFKLRSKIYDSLILILLFINCAVAIIELPINDSPKTHQRGQPITFLFVLGQNNFHHYLYLFINFYLMGIFVGICYFYHNDMLSHSPLCAIEGEVPFGFCFWFVNKCDRLQSICKYLCLLLSIAFLLLLSLSFTIRQSVADDNINYTVTDFDIALSAYEKIIFGFIFSLVLLLLLIHPKDTSFKNFVHCNLFLPLSRITTVFFCICRFVICTAISTCNFTINLGYFDFFFSTIALFITNIIISIVLTILYEMPVRIVIKFIKKKWIKRKTLIESFDSNSNTSNSNCLSQSYHSHEL